MRRPERLSEDARLFVQFSTPSHVQFSMSVDTNRGQIRLSSVRSVVQIYPGPASHDLREWHTILSKYSRHRLRDFLVSDTPRAQRLRQSSPFFAVLSADERDEVLALLENRP